MLQNVSQLAESLQRFSWPDYLVFGFMLLSCILIGIYFGWQDHQKHKQHRHKIRRGSEALDYLVGGRKMQVFPVSISLIASLVSGISLLGTSTETYVYGIQYCYIYIAIILSSIMLHYVYLPVFIELGITSTYEYLQRRFDQKVRLFGSVSFLLSTIIYIPIVIYVPALAFNQVTGVNIYVVTPIVCFICIFYTCVGGLKAVVWSDVLQGFIMLGAMIVIVVKGTINVGGLGVVLSQNLESARIEAPIWDLDPTIRHSFWSTVIGGFFFWNSETACYQGMVQRYLALPSINHARKAIWIFTVGIIFVWGICAYNGLLIYAIYHECDPLQTGLAKEKDQLVPLLVMNVLGNYPGATGCFVAGVFSAALSSLSTSLNSLAAVILEDFIKPIYKDRLTEKATSWIMRLTVILFGILAVAMAFVVEHLGQVLELSLSMAGAAMGPLLGVYIIGFFIPWINSNSSFLGAIISLTITSWIVIKAQIDSATGYLTYDTKPTSINGCTYSYTNLTTNSSVNDIEEFRKSPIFHMSYLYYTIFGVLITLIIACLSTLFLFGKQNPKEVDPKLLAPFIRKYFKSTESCEMQAVTYDFVKDTETENKINCD